MAETQEALNKVHKIGINDLIDNINITMSSVSDGMKNTYARALIFHLLQEGYTSNNDIQDIINRVAPTRTL